VREHDDGVLIDAERVKAAFRLFRFHVVDVVVEVVVADQGEKCSHG